MRDHAPHTRSDRLLTDEELHSIGMGEPPRREPVLLEWVDEPKWPWWVLPAHAALIVAGLLIGWALS